ncbi:hypothetical protein A3O11_01725 [Ligilactobacillus aviarius]|uniref:SpaA isopeptide-forming pilin-related protein n=1 Tax=Ligilactobacillus aviarius TaxID=1606 RepID=UPI0007D9884D|nr:SpaA isopeptide-forming pilin-related protein [Ligilactobacillus aviarius]OAQ05369.1 hypothetical protein A3O10_02985 [Ligilactobacillus aviarius]OAQ05806.1 hypothetical protein A3O11_01725 [Ligilactobacillus aviarius]PEG71066.1 hypothetical protein A3P04_02800 [Ligilactobacillus aviarius]PEG74191.1 hypothetical protein A3O82_02035 [Ligilactobacillus aviarius]
MDKAKAKLLRLITVVASILLAITPALNWSNCGRVEAADVTNSMVDSVTTNIGTAKPGQKVTFHVHFSGKKDYPVKAGDTITINFPQATQNGAGIQGIPHSQPLIYNNPDNPNDPDNGKDMGTVEVTKTGVTITFNKTAAGLKTIDGGDFQFTGIISVEKGTNPTQTNPWPQGGSLPTPTVSVGQTVPSGDTSGIQQGGTPNIVMPTGQVSKSGAIDTKTGNINWQVHGVLGKPGTTTISDVAKDGQTFLPDTFHIKFFGELPNGQWENITIVRDMSGATGISSNDLKNSGLGSYTTSSNGFTLQINDANVATALSDNNTITTNGASGGISFGPNATYKTIAYTITYQTKLSSDEVTTQWDNEANQTNPDGSKTNTAQGIVANTWSNDIWGTQPKDGVVFDKQNSDGVALPGATFELTGKGQDQTVTSSATGMVKFTNLTNGETYTVKEIKAPKGYKVNNDTITVKIVNDKPVITINGSETKDNIIVDKPIASSSSSMSSSSKKVSSSKKSSSLKSSSKKIASSSKKSSSLKSSSVKSSSIKSSVKSSSKASSKKSSMIKSSSKASSEVSSVESSSKEVASSSSMKSTTAKSHRGGARPVKNSSSVESSSNVNTESSSTMNTVSSSANKPSKDTETSVKVPSKTSTISYVDKSTEKSVPVTVSSETNTMVESSVSSAVRTGSGSSSFGSSMINKPTLVSSSMNVPATSWSKEIVNGSSATTVGTTVITYSQSEIPNTNKESNSVVNKPTANTATTQNTTVINNNHSTNQGEVAVVGNNNNNGNNAQGGQTNQGGQAAQGNKSGKGNGNGHGEGLPQTGEAAATAAVGLGIAVIAISGVVLLDKKKN